MGNIDVGVEGLGSQLVDWPLSLIIRVAFDHTLVVVVEEVAYPTNVQGIIISYSMIPWCLLTQYKILTIIILVSKIIITGWHVDHLTLEWAIYAFV